MEYATDPTFYGNQNQPLINRMILQVMTSKVKVGVSVTISFDPQVVGYTVVSPRFFGYEKPAIHIDIYTPGSTYIAGWKIHQILMVFTRKDGDFLWSFFYQRVGVISQLPKFENSLI